MAERAQIKAELEDQYKSILDKNAQEMEDMKKSFEDKLKEAELKGVSITQQCSDLLMLCDSNNLFWGWV